MSSGLEAAAGNKMKQILEKLTANRFLGVLVGAVITAVIQSSSATTVMVVGFVNSGMMTLDQAVWIIMGANIGTTITGQLIALDIGVIAPLIAFIGVAMVVFTKKEKLHYIGSIFAGLVFTAIIQSSSASVGTSRNAKRTTVIHISFNIIGTILFTTLCLVTPLIVFVEGWTPDNPSAQIANLHTIFNIVTTLVLLPVGTLLTKFATFVLRNKEDTKDALTEHRLINITHMNPDRLGASATNMDGTRKELLRMLHMAMENVQDSFDVFAGKDVEKFSRIEDKEEYIDYLNKEISKYITTAMTHEHTKEGSSVFSAYYSMTSNIERIGDHALNIADDTMKIALIKG